MTRDGKVAYVATIPACDFCGRPARYDFKTQHGPWAYGCEADYEVNRLYEDLGTGKGQRLVKTDAIRQGS